ncbi:DMT family transporter [Aquibaculum sediminis]|uniref:DMT family transporter n=1 Tax=Aquibaculum sediminis TaxID=3231907 RepID=UPI0034554F3B
MSEAAGSQSGLAQMAANRRGILWMLLAVMLFVVLDTFAKLLSETYPVWQIVWARYTFHLVLIALFLRGALPRTLRTRRLPLQLLRSLLLVITTGLFFMGLSMLQLAEAAAVMLLGPLFITALSVPFLGEKVGMRRWAGVFAGLVGALIVIRPGTDVFVLASLFPLAAALVNAFYHITTRLLSHSDSSMTTLTYSSLVGAVVMTLGVPFFWVQPDLIGWIMMVGVGLIGGSSHFCLIKSYSEAPAAVVAPFGYSNIVWAVLFGFVVWGDLPDAWTLLGAGILVVSGLYVFHREQVRKHQKR